MTLCSLDVLTFPSLEPVHCSMSGSNCYFLTCIQISQEAGQVVWSSHLFQNFPQFVVIHTVKGFSIVSKAEIYVFLDLLLFRWSSGCWQFDLWFLCLFEIQLEHLEVHGSHTVEAWLGEFFASVWNECSCAKEFQKKQENSRKTSMSALLIMPWVHQGCVLSPCLFNLYAE